ncbi:hypothetical protein HDU76_003572 [Blyttiomyces sp. JEL0837]|nr:hypothetical protein HDU76_003572 [Blyttiomyces sp. JEL0837]
MTDNSTFNLAQDAIELMTQVTQAMQANNNSPVLQVTVPSPTSLMASVANLSPSGVTGAHHLPLVSPTDHHAALDLQQMMNASVHFAAAAADAQSQQAQLDAVTSLLVESQKQHQQQQQQQQQQQHEQQQQQQQLEQQQQLQLHAQEESQQSLIETPTPVDPNTHHSSQSDSNAAVDDRRREGSTASSTNGAPISTTTSNPPMTVNKNGVPVRIPPRRSGPRQSSICHHNKRRSQCVQCYDEGTGGSTICKHRRQRYARPEVKRYKPRIKLDDPEVLDSSISTSDSGMAEAAATQGVPPFPHVGEVDKHEPACLRCGKTKRVSLYGAAKKPVCKACHKALQKAAEGADPNNNEPPSAARKAAASAKNQTSPITPQLTPKRRKNAASAASSAPGSALANPAVTSIAASNHISPPMSPHQRAALDNTVSIQCSVCQTTRMTGAVDISGKLTCAKCYAHIKYGKQPTSTRKSPKKGKGKETDGNETDSAATESLDSNSETETEPEESGTNTSGAEEGGEQDEGEKRRKRHKKSSKSKSGQQQPPFPYPFYPFPGYGATPNMPNPPPGFPSFPGFPGFPVIAPAPGANGAAATSGSAAPGAPSGEGAAAAGQQPYYFVWIPPTDANGNPTVPPPGATAVDGAAGDKTGPGGATPYMWVPPWWGNATNGSGAAGTTPPTTGPGGAALPAPYQMMMAAAQAAAAQAAAAAAAGQNSSTVDALAAAAAAMAGEGEAEEKKRKEDGVAAEKATGVRTFGEPIAAEILASLNPERRSSAGNLVPEAGEKEKESADVEMTA